MTIADIQYYCEIVTLMQLKKRELTAEVYPNLASWFNERRCSQPEIMALDKKLKDVVGKYNF